MAYKRKNDPPGAAARYRTERLQQDGGQWFFSTREGTLEGPFASKYRAESALQAYISVAHLQLVEPGSRLSLQEKA